MLQLQPHAVLDPEVLTVSVGLRHLASVRDGTDEFCTVAVIIVLDDSLYDLVQGRLLLRFVIRNLLEKGLGRASRRIHAEIEPNLPLQEADFVVLADPWLLEEAGEEYRAINAMHVVEVKLDLFWWMLGGPRKIHGCIGHFRSLFCQLGWFHGELASIFDHLIGSPLQDSISDLVTVAPVCCSAKLLVGANLVKQGHDALHARSVNRTGSFLGTVEVRGKPGVMHSCHRESFSNNGRLFEFHSKAKVNDGVQES